MPDAVSKTAQLTSLLIDSGRITVRRVESETGMPRRMIYRYVKSMAKHLPVCVENGVILMQKEEKAI